MKDKSLYLTPDENLELNNLEKEVKTNKFTSKYKLYAVSSNEILTEIESKQKDTNDILTEITPIVNGVSEKNIDINIMYRGNSDILTEIQPVGFEEIETEITIRPNNRMVAIYEIQQPPIVEDVNNPIRDSFNRSEGIYSTINNGSGTSMVVGKVKGEVWESYMRFDLSHIKDSLIFTGMKLRLYYTGTFQDLDLEMFEVRENWREYSITYLNAPKIGRKLNSKYVRNVAERYIDIDVSDIALEWINNPKSNFGIMLKSSDISDDGQMIFRTRESVSPPELIISHYSEEVYSTGRSEIVTEIISMKADVSDKNTEIEVGSVFSMNEMDTQIYVHVKGVPIEDDIETEITASNRYIGSLITVSPIVESDKDTEISIVSGLNANTIDTQIIASNDKCLVEIYSSNINDVLTEINSTNNTRYAEITVSRPLEEIEITVRNRDNSDTLTEITANNDLVLIEISSMKYNDIETEIDVNAVRKNEHETEITVTKPLSYIEISPRVNGRNDMYTQITSSNPDVLVEIRTPEQSNIETEIDVNATSSILTEIIASNDITLVEILPRIHDDSNIDSEIYVKWVNFIETEITSRSSSKVLLEINVKATSNVYTDIVITQDKTFVEIYPRVIGEDNKLAEIEARINMVDNMPTIITVNGKKGAYGFVMG